MSVLRSLTGFNAAFKFMGFTVSFLLAFRSLGDVDVDDVGGLDVEESSDLLDGGLSEIDFAAL